MTPTQIALKLALLQQPQPQPPRPLLPPRSQQQQPLRHQQPPERLKLQCPLLLRSQQQPQQPQQHLNQQQPQQHLNQQQPQQHQSQLQLQLLNQKPHALLSSQFQQGHQRKREMYYFLLMRMSSLVVG